MALITLANQTVPTTPSSGNTTLYTETTTKKLHTIADDGIARMVQALTNANTAQQSIATSDTYITNSNLAIPPNLRVGAVFRWTLAMSRSGAGTAAPVYSVRYGTGASTGDTARVTFTGVAQTGVADAGIHEITIIVRTAGASGVVVGSCAMAHNNANTGLANVGGQIFAPVAAAAFDLTPANSIIGLSVNPGATSTWLFETVIAVGLNL